MSFKVFDENRPLLIAEVAQAHDGSLGIAESYIKLAKKCGADFIKFQTHFAEFESSSLEPWRIKFSQQDETRYDYWKRIEFSFDQWNYLYNVATDTNIGFISSPFSVEAVDILEQLNVPMYKIASGEIENTPMLDRIKETNKPIIISTGLCDFDNLDRLVDYFLNHEICILHCVSEYPTKAENANLSKIQILKDRYKQCAIGLSDHSGTIYPSLLSLHYGLSIIEVHLTFHRDIFGPDTSSSLNEKQFKALKDGIEFYELSKKNIIIKATKTAQMKKTFGRSCFLKSPLRVGEILEKSNLIMKKPAVGISYLDVMRCIGRRAIRDIDTNTPLLVELFE